MLMVAMLGGGAAYGAGFQVSETSVLGLGRAFAGAGVAGDGPADMFHNPAALMLGQGRQFEVGLHAILPGADFENRGSTITGVTPPFTTPAAIGDDADGGVDALVPNFFYAADLRGGASAKSAADLEADVPAKWRYGLGLTAPYGLTTDYRADWVGRYHAIKSELKTVEINPAVAWRPSKRVSLGAGITWLHAEAELSNAVYIPEPVTTSAADARATVTGDADAFGFTLGALLGDEKRRIGVGYRSSVDLKVRGDLSVVAPGPAAAVVNPKTAADITLPATAYVSAFQNISDKIDLLATWRWTEWSEFDELRVTFADGSDPAVTPYRWENSNTYSIGINFRPTERWHFRGGVARDETPISDDQFRTPRIPDANRDWLSLGGSFLASSRTRWDFSWARIFAEKARLKTTADINSSLQGSGESNLTGTYPASATDIFALRFAHTFD